MKVMEYELKKMRYNELKNEIKLCGEIYKDNDWVNLNEWNELRKMFSNEQILQNVKYECQKLF